MEDIFQLSENIAIQIDVVSDSKVYVIDDFYYAPKEVLKFLSRHPTILNKANEKPSYNQIYFEDRRHYIENNTIHTVYSFLSTICSQRPVGYDDIIITNVNRFRKCEFNDYENNYWWPHLDHGYTGIVYLSDDNVSGTNLYNKLNFDNDDLNYPEHYRPWKDKKDYQLIKSLEPKFNRLVLFDGLKFYHGMNIVDDRYFNEKYRVNQVFFFEQPK